MATVTGMMESEGYGLGGKTGRGGDDGLLEILGGEDEVSKTLCLFFVHSIGVSLSWHLKGLTCSSVYDWFSIVLTAQ